MDKFPEAFDRFEETVEVDRIDSFNALTSAFASWAGQKFLYTRRQMEGLAVEASEREKSRIKTFLKKLRKSENALKCFKKS